jgi:hypothetical protein
VRFAIAGALCALLAGAGSAWAQVTPAPPSPALRVFLSCERCDDPLKSAITFAQFVTTRDGADVDVTVSEATETDQRVWTVEFAGKGTFEGQARRLTLELPASATAEEVRGRLTRLIRFGLAEFAFKTPAGAHLDVSFESGQAPGQEAAAAAGSRARDPWNYWVFRMSTSGDRYGERSQSSSYFSGSASANRTTEAWKIRLSAYRSLSRSRFMVTEDETFRTKEGDWSTDGLLVKSLGEHWSAGVTGGISASTYSNQKLLMTLNPAVEYDVFPYSESSHRSLTIQYALGVSRYRYHQLTLFDKLEETMPRHSLTTSLGFRQPWGTAGAGVTFSQSLNTTAFNRLSLSGSLNIRIFRGFTVNANGSFSRIRDQFYLEKSDASEEEILLRLRQIATGHRYSFSSGFTYSFGSLSNATVNPRFGG